MVNLLLPKDCFYEDQNKTLGIWLSGGADSSILCYLLAKHIIDNKLDFKIQPVTIPKRKTDTYHVQVLDFIKQELECDSLFLDPIVEYYPESEYVTGDAFFDLHIKCVKDKKYKYIYSGITRSPDASNHNKHWKDIPEISNLRGETVNRLTVINVVFEIDGELHEFGDIRPLFRHDKKDIASLYTQYDLLDTLFPLTNSCNDMTITKGHCGECWFCNERKWAFGKI